MKRGSTSRGTALAAGLVITAALAGCGIGPGAADDAAKGGGSGAVAFDDVQSAVIQLEAQGTFVDPETGGYETAGRGSGFLISEDGLAITNNHVVTGAGTLDVWRGGDTSETINAKILGSSECLDLAVVQLRGSDFPYLGWHEGEIATATDVYAAGFPLGDPTFTMTRGIVSKASTAGETPWASLDLVIEHDAKIRPGNSGGPLVDAEGRVVGVNYAGSDAYDANFAIHRDEVQDVVEQLAAGENVLSLGINGQALTDEEGNGLGVWVSSVAAGSAADKAGIAPGDLLTRLQGVSVGLDGTLGDYCDVLRTHGEEAALDVELFRFEEGAYYRGQLNSEKPLTAVRVTSGEGQATGAFVDAQDDTGTVHAQVPAAWKDFEGAPLTDAKGVTWQGITVSPDLAGFRSGWSVPGVLALASRDAVRSHTPESLVAEAAAGNQAEGCTADAAQPYSDDRYSGVVQTFSGCGGVGAGQIVVAAESAQGDHLIYLQITAISEDDLAVIDRVLGSFQVTF